jgi:serine/threonine-protein kinase PknG
VTCPYPGCAGTVDETGFCTDCGRRPPPQESGPVTAPPESSVTSGGWTIARVVTMPVLTFDDPSSRVLADLDTVNVSGTCGKDGCRTPIGVGYAGQPALLEGFCPTCGTPYSLRPRLAPGDLVADQYEVVGPIAHGGLGWVYLARDTHLDGNYVALKGLINTNDRAALSLAVAERRFLTSLDHANIVRIFNFVVHEERPGEQTGYIVMEYLNGRSLREIQGAALQDRPPGGSLPLEHVVAYGHEILAAMQYLHGRGLLYCDMKPDNVIRTEDRVKLIDLGGVRHVDDRTSPIVGTARYQVGREELTGRGPSVQSDIHTVGRTLEVLFHSSADHLSARRTGSGDGSTGLGLDSFQRLVRRATDPDWNRRFATAAEMSEQLTGVLHEVLSVRLGREHPEPSAVFAPTAALLDAGLGAVPSLERWTGTGPGAEPGDGRPSAPSVATGLPVPRVDPRDPNVDLLSTVSAPDPRGLLDQLSAVDADSVEVELMRCRAHVELGDTDGAARCIERAASILGTMAPYDWRLSWHRGLRALARDTVGEASPEFLAVYDAIPGEIAPKLALGCCAELSGQPDHAARFYEAVWRRDRSQASAAFGLARIRLGRGDRAGAMAVLDGVPRVSRHYDAARIAAVRISCGRFDGGSTGLSAADLSEAVRRLRELDLDGGDADGESRQRLTAAVRETALDWIRSGRRHRRLDGGAVLGTPATEAGLRGLLERSFRLLARQARSADDHGTLVDLANAVRPRTLL